MRFVHPALSAGFRQSRRRTLAVFAFLLTSSALLAQTRPPVRTSPPSGLRGEPRVTTGYSLLAWGDGSVGNLGVYSSQGYCPDFLLVSDLNNVIALSQGNEASLALKSDGTVWAWGSNGHGELGNGVAAEAGSLFPTPAPVVGPGGAGQLSGIIAVALGGDVSLALKSDGTVWAWGDNESGELGHPIGSDGDIFNIQEQTYSNPEPSQVVGPGGAGFLTGIVQVAEGGGGSGYASVSYALRNDGTVWNWGYINPDSIRNPAPVQVTGLPQITALSAGNVTTFALAADGTVWGWGDNTYGELGLPLSTTGTTTPVQITALNNVSAIASLSGFSSSGLLTPPPNAFTLVLKSDGTVWAFGDNTYGQLGHMPGAQGDMTTATTGYHSTINPTPTQVSGLSGIVSVAAGVGQSLALASNGSVYGWGLNGLGELGIGTASLNPFFVSAPAQTGDLTAAVAIAAGGDVSMALQNDGRVYRAGSGYFNTPTLQNQYNYVAPQGLPSLTAIGTAPNRGYAVDINGNVWDFGDNSYGAVGDGTTHTLPYPTSPTSMHNRPIPSHVLGPNGVGYLSDVIAVNGGENDSIALKSDGTVWQWGYGSLTPVEVIGPDGVTPLSSVVSILTGYQVHEAVTSSGSAYIWTDNTSVTQVADLPNNIVAVYGGLALDASGVVWTWGDNTYGQLGHTPGTDGDVMEDGTYMNPTPMPVSGLSSVIAIATASSYNLALESDGTLWSWGDNADGEQGTGSSDQDPHPVPTQIAGLPPIIAISAAPDSVYALTSAGDVFAWGANFEGGLGIGYSDPQPPVMTTPHPPTQVIGIRHAVAIAAEEQFCLALVPTATISGSLSLSLVPTAVMQSITVQFRPTDGSPSFTQVITVGPGGAFSLTAPVGSYNLAFRGDRWLQSVVAVDTTGGPVSNLNVTLFPGDINGDNVIDLKDFNLLALAFGTDYKSVNWNTLADLNGDGQIDLKDFSLFADNFGKAGDN